MIGKAAVIGASGYVGRHLLEQLGGRALGTYAIRPVPGLAKFDIARDRLGTLRQRGAALTHLFLVGGVANPELCAKDPIATRAVNVERSIRLLDECMQTGVFPVFISTDYVFEGSRGDYREQDPTAPTTEYGRQKKEVEDWLIQSGQPYLLARLSKVVGIEIGVHSIIGQWCAEIKAGKAIRAASDQVFSPAWNGDIARALTDLCDERQTGIWHAAGPEAISRLHLAEMLAEEVRKVAPAAAIDLGPCRLNDVGFAEIRPLKTWLNVGKLKAFLSWQFRPLREICAEAVRLHFG